MIPPELQEALEREIQKLSFRDLKKGREDLTQRYRSTTGSKQMSTSAEQISYLATRLPATFSAIAQVLSQIPFENASLLDLGSGPGTLLWACYPNLSQATLLETNPGLIQLGKNLNPPLNPTWLHADMRTALFPSADLVTLSYSLGELPPESQAPILQKAWAAAQKYLVIIEPGTPRGSSTTLRARDLLISLNAQIVAPCPHRLPCPMPPPHWCHFSVRLPRLKIHKLLKEASLGYEDEKYCYVILSKTAPPPYSRIVASPEHHSGHTKLTLCTPPGIIAKTTFTRSQGPIYKTVKKLEWGDKV